MLSNYNMSGTNLSNSFCDCLSHYNLSLIFNFDKFKLFGLNFFITSFLVYMLFCNNLAKEDYLFLKTVLRINTLVIGLALKSLTTPVSGADLRNLTE